jgi:hypothetical protein
LTMNSACRSQALEALQPNPAEWSKILEICGFGTITGLDRTSRKFI